MDLLNKACFLGHQFRFLSFLSVEEKVVTDSIFDEKVEGNLTVTGINEDVEPRSKKLKLLTLLGDVFEHTSSPNLTT